MALMHPLEGCPDGYLLITVVDSDGIPEDSDDEVWAGYYETWEDEADVETIKLDDLPQWIARNRVKR
jgi:hypothetical protein